MYESCVYLQTSFVHTVNELDGIKAGEIFL